MKVCRKRGGEDPLYQPYIDNFVPSLVNDVKSKGKVVPVLN